MDNSKYEENLIQLLKQNSESALPYLFIGSGLSRRYLNLPDWKELLRIFAREAGLNFNYINASNNENLPKVATHISEKFHDIWWNSEKYETQRQKYGDKITNKAGSLKVAVSEYLATRSVLAAGTPGFDNIDLRTEIASLKEVVVNGVITTNYDNFTDLLFPQFKPYIGQDGLIMSDAQFIAETYKIHGSVGQPESLVLTEEDYTDFRGRNHYLAAKLLTIFAEHPVLFIGYSLNDEYIREILANIATAVGSSRLEDLGRRIYFVEWNSEYRSIPSIQSTSMEKDGSILPITRIRSHSFQWIWNSLGRLERGFPAGVLRELRKHVFNLVTNPSTDDQLERVRAIPIDSPDAQDVKLVFGVGRFSNTDLEDLPAISARTLERRDLEQDVLGLRDRSIDANNVLKYGIPQQIRAKKTDNIPLWKYLRESGRIKDDGQIDYTDLEPIICKLAEKEITSPGDDIKTRYFRDVKGTYDSPEDIFSSENALYFKFQCLLLIDCDSFNLEEVKNILVEYFSRYDSMSDSEKGQYRKVLVRYDRLKYGTLL